MSNPYADEGSGNNINIQFINQEYVPPQENQYANHGYVPPPPFNPEEYHYPQLEEPIQQAQIVNENINLNVKIYSGEPLPCQVSNNQQFQYPDQYPIGVQPDSMQQPIMINQNNIPQPLPPAAPSPAGLEESLNSSAGEQSIIRNLKDIQECRHSNPSKYMYITTPKIILSAIILIFYVLGLVTLIAGVVILIIVLILAIFAAAEGNGGNSGDCGNCGDCGSCGNCNFCDSNAFLGICRCCEICCLSFGNNNSYNVNYYAAQECDYNYYRHRYHRKRNYVDYELGQNSAFSSGANDCCASICDCMCCGCLDVLSLGQPKQGCIVSKVEVYCTECNSKLKEEYQGADKMGPAVLLGIFGGIILTVSLVLLSHYT